MSKTFRKLQVFSQVPLAGLLLVSAAATQLSGCVVRERVVVQPPPPPPAYVAPAAEAEAQASEPPPPLPVYEQPPCPVEGYIWTPGYWAWGIGAEPTVDLLAGPIHVAGSALVQQFWPIHGLDAEASNVHGEALLHDNAFLAEGWLGVRPVDKMEISAGIQKRVRQGIVGNSTATADETSLMSRLALVF